MYDFSKIKNFKESEFVCKCCGKIKISMDLIQQLDTARNYARVPFVITSGYRCIRHNKAVGGVVNSAHLEGLAADIETKDPETRLAVMRGLCMAGFKRIVIEQGCVHADVDYSKPLGLHLKL